MFSGPITHLLILKQLTFFGKSHTMTMQWKHCTGSGQICWRGVIRMARFLIFCFLGFIGPFFGAFLKNKPMGQLKNAITDNFPRWRFFVSNNISLDLWVIVIFVGLSLDLWVFRYPYGVIVKLSLFPTCPFSNIC